MGKNNFLFPQQSHLEMIKGALTELGAAGAFKQPVTRQEGVWEAEIYSSSGAIFEKATVARVDLCGGLVEEVPTDITLLQAFAWPANPHVPGMIIMASASSTEGADPIITFFTDLIMQNGVARQADKDAFTAALLAACQRHGQDIAEYQTLMAGRGMLGECAAECGMLYFFEESDAAFLDDCIKAALQAYRRILDSAGSQIGGDKGLMAECRKKIKEWMVTQDYGVKVARQNGIPDELMGIYGFPPGL
ncbi:MAG: hypothetical protein WCQ99_06805 [Pseudomonadota bacterium]